MRIFVVDDDRDLAESLAEVLELSGHEVEIAFSGEEAVEIFRQRDFDISFMDVVMPGMNGVESFLEIRKIKPDAKVFMLTGYSVAQLLDQALDNGALGVLEKPIGIEELLARIDSMKDKQGDMVLVADDDPAFRDSLEEVLKQQGYNVCVATTGEEAVEKVMAGGIDLLALDLRLPVLSGLEVYLELKNRGHAVPTVIMSGHINEESEAVSTLCDMSVTGILTKPFDPAHLIAAMDRIATGGAKAADPAPSTAAGAAGQAPAAPADSAFDTLPQAPVTAPTPLGTDPAPPPADLSASPRGRAAAAAPEPGPTVVPILTTQIPPAAAPVAAATPATNGPNGHATPPRPAPAAPAATQAPPAAEPVDPKPPAEDWRTFGST